MPKFEPFPGLRYSASHIRALDDVVCPPYDVISEADRHHLIERSPSNVVRLELPVEEEAGADRYEKARELLDAWRDGGILHRDSAPCFYGYRMTFTDPGGRPSQTLGVIGALGLEPPGHGILPHEETTPKAKTDRLELIRATRANLSPIWGLSPTAGLTGLLNPPSHPVEKATDDDGITHELWPISDPAQVAAIAASVAAQPVLIADGHHRFETALNYQAEEAAAGRSGIDEGSVMCLIVELAPDQLTVQPIHRLLVGLPAGFDVIEAFAPSFDITPTEPVDWTIASRMADAGGVAILTPEQAYLARPLDHVISAATHDLDSSRLDVALSGFPEFTLVYQHGWDHAALAVASKQASAAVLVRPATVGQIADISRGGVRMPPKTTFFWPKPRTGMVIRELVS